MYRVIIWNTNEVLDEFTDLKTAKKIARGQGHEGEAYGRFYPPIARVDEPMQDDGSDGWGVCYNPKFYVGKHDNFKPTPYVKRVIPGPRRCSHDRFHGCPKGCN